MNEPAPPMAIPLAGFLFAALGLYVLLGALTLERYWLVAVACACFMAAIGFPLMKFVLRA